MGMRSSGCKGASLDVSTVAAVVVSLVAGMNLSFQTVCRTDTGVSVRQFLVSRSIGRKSNEKLAAGWWCARQWLLMHGYSFVRLVTGRRGFTTAGQGRRASALRAACLDAVVQSAAPVTSLMTGRQI